jgi:hypothetical protein
MNAYDTSFSTQLPSDLVKRLRLHAVSEGVEIREVVREALDTHLPRIRLIEESARRAGK